uniref:Cytochrome P450 2G1-like n=1 Tax=Sphaeramia orbicularis TaxID=375764 RepID=A0A673BSN7_9TELE
KSTGSEIQFSPADTSMALPGVELSERYGPVVTVYLGPQRAVALIGYEAVKDALVNQGDDFTGRGPLPFFMKVTNGYGLAISNGERWRQLRHFTLTTLKDFGMGRKGMEQWIQEESKYLVARIHGTKASPFDPTYFLSCSVSNVICCLVFGQRFDYNDDHFLHLLQITAAILEFTSSPSGLLYDIFPQLMECLPGRHHKLFTGIEELKKFIRKNIQEHEDTLDMSSPRDYIDCFLTRANMEKDLPTTEFNNDNLVPTVLNLFAAGTDSTSSTIKFALSVLSKYPKIQEKMQQEIDTVIGRNRDPFMQDRKSLPFTDAVLHEIQRFMDFVPMGVPHYTLRDILFRSYRIPKDTLIFPILHSVLKEEKHWVSPFSFNPEHFLDHNGNFKKNPAFMPFSVCWRVSGSYGAFIFLISLLQNFTFSIPGGPDSIDLSPEQSSFVNVPRTYRVIATPR